MRGDEDRVEEDVAQLRVAVAGEDAQRVVDVGGVDRIAALEEPVELEEDAAHELGLQRVAVQREGRVGDVDAHAHLSLERLHVLVVLAEQLAEETRVGEAELGGCGGGLGQGAQRLPAPSSS